MPKVIRRRPSPIAWILLLCLAALYGFGLWKRPVAVGGLTVLMALAVVEKHVRTKRLLTRLAEARSQESICTFTRSFDARRVDTWVIRAVYEELQNWLKPIYPAFPLRSSDRLREDLRLDDDDVGLDLAQDISERTGRRLENTRKNPYYGEVRTVGDLVLFFGAQPPRAT